MRRKGLVAVGALLLILLGWRFRRAAQQNSCLDKGGTWHAESGTCGGMPLPQPPRTAVDYPAPNGVVVPADLIIAGVHLGDDSAAVHRVLGVPDSMGQSHDPSQAAPLPGWFYPGLEVVFLNERVHGVWLKGGRWATYRGLKVGDSLAVATNLYGAAPPSVTSYAWSLTSGADSAGLYISLESGWIRTIYLGNSID